MNANKTIERPSDTDLTPLRSMDRPVFSRWLLCYFMGAAALLLLQWHFSYSWAGYYSRFPWQGYQQAMKAGKVPAFLTGSPRSLLVGGIALFLLAFLMPIFFRSRKTISSIIAVWTGVMTAAVAVWAATPALRQDSNLWPIDFIFIAFWTGIPIWLGGLLALMIRKLGPQQRT